MKPLIRPILKKLLNFIGIQIRPTGTGLFGGKHKFSPTEEDRFKWLNSYDIRTVIDVGAHIGEFAAQIREILPSTYIYSFEPLPEEFEQLERNLKKINNVKLFNLAMGESHGELTMYRSNYSASSSFFKMGGIHKNAFPFSAQQIPVPVKMSTLDEVHQELKFSKNILLKVDVQGYEGKVLRGGKKLLQEVKIIIVETSFQELYCEQPLFHDIYQLLYEHGFKYYGAWGDLKDPTNGMPLQQDSIFIRP